MKPHWSPTVTSRLRYPAPLTDPKGEVGRAPLPHSGANIGPRSIYTRCVFEKKCELVRGFARLLLSHCRNEDILGTSERLSHAGIGVSDGD